MRMRLLASRSSTAEAGGLVQWAEKLAEDLSAAPQLRIFGGPQGAVVHTVQPRSNIQQQSIDNYFVPVCILTGIVHGQPDRSRLECLHEELRKEHVAECESMLHLLTNAYADLTTPRCYVHAITPCKCSSTCKHISGAGRS